VDQDVPLPAIDSCPLAAKSWLTVVANLASAHTGCSEPSFRSAAAAVSEPCAARSVSLEQANC
jgi:hypothetical protein